MPRVKARLLNVLAAASLGFGVVVAALLARSFVRHDYLHLGRVASPNSHANLYVVDSA
jgi:hypothetical protein